MGRYLVSVQISTGEESTPRQKYPTLEIGQKYGRLTVKSLKKADRYHYAFCNCDCGGEILVFQSNLRSGATKSCGCMLADLHARRKRHGDGNKKATNFWLYARWFMMKNRANSKSIYIDPAWKDYAVFRESVGLPPGSPKNYKLVRIEPENGFIPGNMEWREVANNETRSSIESLIERALANA